MKNFLTLILSVLLGSTAQLFLKKGVSQTPNIEFNQKIFLQLVSVVFNVYTLLGLFLYGLSLLIWLIVLSKTQLSVAYPLVSIGYIFTLIFGAIFFKENITMNKVIGILVICAGVAILSFNLT